MQSLRIDFSMNRGHEMTIDREQGIVRSDLDELELRMLRTQRVPYLLPIDWLEMDGKVTFRYSLTGMKMLVHRLQGEAITMSRYYTLLLAVTDALLECREYMLRPEGCLLNDQFIFTGERMGDIRLAYLPLKTLQPNAEQKGDDLLALVVRWTSYVERIDGEGLKRIMQLLNRSRFPLSDLRETLLDLIVIESGAARQESMQPLLMTSMAEDEQSPKLDSGPARPVTSDQSDKEEQFGEDIIPYAEDTDAPEERNKGKWITGALSLLIAACIWRFIYVQSPSVTRLLFCGGLTLLLLGAVIYIWSKGSGLLLTKGKPMEESELFEPQSVPLRSKHSWKWADEQMEGGTTGSMGSRSLPTPVKVDHSEKEEEVTTLLGFSHHHAWLKRVYNGSEETIKLASDSFKIGRSSEGVCYEESADGVSRLHLEIERIDGEHHAKDLGSRNGSLLNGKLMVPYKAYKLSSGDYIHLAGDKGPLYELKSG